MILKSCEQIQAKYCILYIQQSWAVHKDKQGQTALETERQREWEWDT